MIATDAFAGAFGSGPTDDMGRLARNAARAGFAVLPIEPLGKVVLCTLTARQARMADITAQEAGERKHACGVHHAITDPVEAGRVFTRMAKERPGLNIAVEAGKSRMVLADADNAESVDSWQNVWYEHEAFDGLEPDMRATPTVLTPGAQLPDGTWAHKDGAHFWYRLTDDQLADLPSGGPGSMQLPGGVSLSWRDRYALVPPSVRAEGPYRLVGKVSDCPEWLFEMIADHALEQIEMRLAKLDKVASQGPDDIEEWSRQTTWTELLEAAGWTTQGHLDSCGPHCEIWTRPGDAGTAKSATAHLPECTVTDTSTGWGPLHIWSDVAAEALGSKHLSKLQFYARTQFDGDTGAAMAAAGIRPTGSQELSDELEALVEAFLVDPRRSREPESEPSPPTGPTPTPGSGSEFRPLKGGRVDLAALLAGEESDGPAPSILHRSDGNALFYRSAINQLIGESEGGKTWVALAAVVEVLSTGGRAAYVDVDANGAPSLVARMRQLGADLETAVAEDRLAVFVPGDVDTLREVITIVTRSDVDLVVVDSFGEAMPMASLSTNDNDEVTSFMRDYLTPMAEAGTCVLVIDHVVKNAEQRMGHGIGAQAKKRRTDGAYIEVQIADVFSHRLGGRARLYVRKDRFAGLNNATAKDRYWGAFVLEAEGGGFRLESAAPATTGDALAELSDTAQRHMVSVSAYLDGLLKLAVTAGELEPQAVSARSGRQLREASLGVRAADMTPTLNRLLEAGSVGRTLVGGHEKWHSVAPYLSLEQVLDEG